MKIESIKLADDVPGLTDKVMEIANYMFSVSQESIVSNGTSDTGSLLQSGVPPHWEGNKIVFGYSAPHAVHIEYGTLPHWVPIEPLIGWSERKLGLPKPEATSAAYAIRAKIAKEGQMPQPFLRVGVNAGIVKYGLSIPPMYI